MIERKKIRKWSNVLYKLRDETREYLNSLEKMDVITMEKIPRYDVRLHQHLESLSKIIDGGFLLIDQICYDFDNKKYTGEN